MTLEAEKLTNSLLYSGIDPFCGWCGKKYSEHTDALPEHHNARVPCAFLKSHFYPAKDYWKK